MTHIYDSTFENCSNLTSIIISNGVTSIGSNAFYKCSSLTSINIPESVTSIGSRAFWNCSKLTSINIPNSVTSIGDYAFQGCSKLLKVSDITIPNAGYRIENGVLLDGFGKDDRFYQNGSIFTGTKDGIEYIDGFKQIPIFAEYTGESFYCNIPNLKDYKTEYTVIKFTPDYTQEYQFSINNNNIVLCILRNPNNIINGKYQYYDSQFVQYLEGGITYYVGIAKYSGTGSATLEVSPYYDSSSSYQDSSYYGSSYYGSSSY